MCRRHNSALSPLDAVAGRFFRTLRKLDLAMASQDDTGALPVYLFNGIDLERWLAKTMIAFFRCKRSNFQAPAYRLQPDALDLFRVPLRTPMGLYIRASQPDNEGIWSVRLDPIASVAHLANEKQIVGLRATLCGLPMILVSDDVPDTAAATAGYVRRPHAIVFDAPRRVYVIAFAWPPQNEAHPTIVLRHDGAAPAPRSNVR